MSADENRSESEAVKVKIYTLSTCGYCWMAKRLLQSYAQPFEELAQLPRKVVEACGSVWKRTEAHGRWGSSVAGQAPAPAARR